MIRLQLPFHFRHSMWLLIAFSLGAVNLHSQERGTFTDVRDGRVYQWQETGTHRWMTENLRFNVPAGSWSYNDDTARERDFGRLYSWKAAQKACPKGWHLPSGKEWDALIRSLGGGDHAALNYQMMDTVGKNIDPEFYELSRAVPAMLSGIRHPDGTCIGINLWGGCWSSDRVNDSVGVNVLFAKGSREIGTSSNDMQSGFSVRCVRK